MLSEATSGLSSAAGRRRSSTVMVGAPPVVRLITTSVAALIFGRNCMNTAGSWVGLPSFAFLACRCTIDAPALAAPIAASAISSGVIGRCGDMVGVWIAPVTAHVMMTLPCAAAIVSSASLHERTSPVRILRMKIEIRRVEPGDYKAVQQVHAQPTALRGTLQLPFPSEEMWKKRLEAQGDDMFALVACVDGEVVAMA